MPRVQVTETGQKVRFGIDTGQLVATGYNWQNVGTHEFGSVIWGPGASQRSSVPIGVPNWQQHPTVELYYHTPANSEQASAAYLISCELTLEDSQGEPIGQVQAVGSLLVCGPWTNLECDLGPTRYTPDPVGATTVVTGGPWLDPPGANFIDTSVLTNYLTRFQLGTGRWVFAQTVKLHRVLTYTVGGSSIIMDTYDLDNTWPYSPNGGSFFANGTPYTTEDSPWHALKSNFNFWATAVNIADSFRMFTAYIPPAHPSNLPREYIGSAISRWYWGVNGVRTGNVWAGTGPGIQSDGVQLWPSAEFQWDGIFTNL